MITILFLSVLSTLLIIALVVMTTLYIFKKAKKENMETWMNSKPITKTQVLGLVYKSKNADISKVMNGIQDLVTTLQSEACNVYKNSNDLKTKFRSAVDQLVPKGKNDIYCAKFIKTINSSRKLFDTMLSEIEVESNIKLKNKGAIINKIMALSKATVEVSCVNKKVDNEKLRKLLYDLMDAICY